MQLSRGVLILIRLGESEFTSDESPRYMPMATRPGEVGVWLYSGLTSAVPGGDWLASRPGRFRSGREPLNVRRVDGPQGWCGGVWRRGNRYLKGVRTLNTLSYSESVTM
jgi:hypothetical protein